MAKVIRFPGPGNDPGGNGSKGNGPGENRAGANGVGGNRHGSYVRPGSQPDAGQWADAQAPGSQPAGANRAGSKDSRFRGLFLFDLGLSDDQVEALICGDRTRRAEIFEVAPRLTEAEAASVPIMRWVAGLLRMVSEAEPLRATAKGNLPAALVKRLFQGPLADAEPWFVKVSREDHSITLSWIRRLTRHAGLLKYRSGMFSLTKAGRTALAEEDWSGIYRLLLEGHLRHPRLLERFDRYEDDGAFSAALPFLLFAARDTNNEYLYEEDFAELLSALGAGRSFRPHFAAHMVALRLFTRFGVPFGLFEPNEPFTPPVETTPHMYRPFGSWRRTPLFDRAFRWHVDPPRQALALPEQAAARLMFDVHDAEIDLDGSADQWVESLCLRAIERCPSDADGWVVWARLYEHEPEKALRIVDTGIHAAGDREPEVSEGTCPWADHQYRDVMRLHFIRSETLLALGREDEAFAQFETLMTIDPWDAMGARDYYVPALVAAGRYEAAEQVLDRFTNDDSASMRWNAVLTAYAQGQTKRARELLESALTANPHIPDQLFARWLGRSPRYYSPGTREEANVYARRSGPAWNSVHGAKDWLRRQRDRR